MKRFLIFLLIPAICLGLAAWSTADEETGLFEQIVAQLTGASADAISAEDAEALAVDDEQEIFGEEDYATLAALLEDFSENPDSAEPLGK